MRHFLFNRMNTFFVTLSATFAAVAALMAGLGVKTLLRKNGEFKRHCAGRDPYSGESSGCACGKDRFCAERHPYNPLDVNENLMKEL